MCASCHLNFPSVYFLCMLTGVDKRSLTQAPTHSKSLDESGSFLKKIILNLEYIFAQAQDAGEEHSAVSAGSNICKSSFPGGKSKRRRGCRWVVLKPTIFLALCERLERRVAVPGRKFGPLLLHTW